MKMSMVSGEITEKRMQLKSVSWLDDDTVMCEVFTNKSKSKFETYKWSWQYVVFGSENSRDLDVLVWIPHELTLIFDNNTHLGVQVCKQLPQVLPKETFKCDDVLDCSLASWNSDGVVTWCQKGTIDETNNAVLLTFDFHRDLQMFDCCPITMSMIRNIPCKILSSVRRIVGCLTRATGVMEDAKVLGILTTQDTFKCLHTTDLETFKRVCQCIFKVPDITGKSQTHPDVSKQTLTGMRVQLNKLMDRLYTWDDHFQLDNFFEEFPNIRNTFSEYLKSIAVQSSDHVLVRTLNRALNACQSFEVSNVCRGILRAKYLGLYLAFLKTIDFTKIDLKRDSTEKYKKIAFQMGQSMALIEGLELFDKDYIAEKYPTLEKFLARDSNVTPDDINDLTVFLQTFVDTLIGFTFDPDNSGLSIYSTEFCLV